MTPLILSVIFSLLWRGFRDRCGFVRVNIQVSPLVLYLAVTEQVGLPYDNLKLVYPKLIIVSGTIIASGTPNDPLLNKRVFLTPSRGWENDPQGPESR